MRAHHGLKHTLFLSLGLLLFMQEWSFAEELVLGVGHTRKPYIMKEKGLEIEIVRAAFQKVDHSITFKYFTNKRLEFAFHQKKVDGILFNQPLSQNQKKNKEFFFSDSHISYHNHAISLTKQNLKIDSVADLWGKRILAFQNAHAFLGSEYAHMTQYNPHYREKADQATQVLWLFNQRTEVVIADQSIFLYHRKLAKDSGKFDVDAAVTFHAIFPPSPIYGLYHSRSLRDAFNLGLEAIRKSGEYEQIFNKYGASVNLWSGVESPHTIQE